MLWQAVVLGIVCGITAAVLCLTMHIIFHKCTCGTKQSRSEASEEAGPTLRHALQNHYDHETMVMEAREAGAVGPPPLPEEQIQCPLQADIISEHGSYVSSDVTPENLSELTSLEEWDEESLDGASGIYHGRLQVSVEYDSHVCQLFVYINRAQIANSLVDPTTCYVSLRLEEQVESRSRDGHVGSLCRASADISLREVFNHPSTYEVAKTSRLRLSLYRQAPDGPELEGWSLIDLSWLTPDTPHTSWHAIRPNLSQQVCPHGMLQVSLCYLPSTENLSVMVVKACNLFAERNTPPDSQVIACIRLNDNTLRRKATTVAPSTSDPEWNEVLMFNVPCELLGQLQLQLLVVDSDLLARGKLLGMCTLGSQLRGTPGTHWRLMTQQHSSPVAMWHFLELP